VPSIAGVELVPAFVKRGDAFLQAARELVRHPVTTIAVLDEDDRVVGLFSGADLLRGLFPGYLEDLHHTSFLTGDAADLGEAGRRAAGEPVERHMRSPVVIDRDASAAHIAERFLHCDVEALPIVADTRFVGMLDRAAFCRQLLTGTGAAEARPPA
jgi:CBS domain-containing protein